MTSDGRDPDAMLARANREARESSGRGRLRIYLGAFPGVGKTYSMLNEAQRRRTYGEDVVVGFVETHGRKNTAAMVEGLEVVPRRSLEYQGVSIDEMDTEAILRRHPAVALVDELAHTNAPGSEHEKRYEDVEELLAAGIDVVATLNVQHLESMNDKVEALTGVRVRETLPDSVLDEADEVILVDLSPEGARARMQHGHIYKPEQASVALERYFTLENLGALRELALRRTAQEVDAQLDDLLREHANRRTDADLAEQVLALVDEKAGARTLIRQAWRLAQGLHAELQVAYLKRDLPELEARELARTLELAEDLNATIVPLEGERPGDALASHIKAAGVEHVVLRAGTAYGFQRLLKRPLHEELMKTNPSLQLHLVPLT